ncbi:unnamed protein product, partial [Cylicocyclus nassatus]
IQLRYFRISIQLSTNCKLTFNVYILKSRFFQPLPMVTLTHRMQFSQPSLKCRTSPANLSC